jgi:hypothetical protein
MNSWWSDQRCHKEGGRAWWHRHDSGA